MVISVVWLLGTEHTPAPIGSPVAVIRARTAIPPAARLILRGSIDDGWQQHVSMIEYAIP
jgi:hypothetical protein